MTLALNIESYARYAQRNTSFVPSACSAQPPMAAPEAAACSSLRCSTPTAQLRVLETIHSSKHDVFRLLSEPCEHRYSR